MNLLTEADDLHDKDALRLMANMTPIDSWIAMCPQTALDADPGTMLNLRKHRMYLDGIA